MPALPVLYTNRPSDQPGILALRQKLSLDALLMAGIGDQNSDGPAATVRRIIGDVHKRGDAALIEFTRQFDGVDLGGRPLRVSPEEIARAATTARPDFVSALDAAIANVRHYQQAMLPAPPHDLRPAGGGETARLAVHYEPLARVGVYVPGGAGAYPSSVVMTVAPAQAAGVKSIAICSPMRGGAVSPAVLTAAQRLGIDEIYGIGGAQAIAAMAIGTQSIPKVDKIVGPGNSYVQLAKKELFGVVDIDSFAGPSEVIVLADDSASARMIAAELLAQAEHAPGSCLLMTASERLAGEVQAELDRQIPQLGRRELTLQALQFASAIIVTPRHSEAIDLVNAFAPEHLQITTRNSRADAEKIVNAGGIFIGAHTPVAAGDYLAGPSHVLPTSGTARFFSGLSAESFRKRISIVEYDAAALAHVAANIKVLAHTEGFDAHARSVQCRE